MQLWQALERVHLKETIESLPEKLESSVHECAFSLLQVLFPCFQMNNMFCLVGENFSVGQRQLLCLARALLRKSKILVMDEATAAVDMDTDSFIQKTIRDSFKDVTVLTIAHRVHTILDYDKILVLDRGMVSQFDTPANLEKDTNGIFADMLKKSSLTKQEMIP